MSFIGSRNGFGCSLPVARAPGTPTPAPSSGLPYGARVLILGPSTVEDMNFSFASGASQIGKSNRTTTDCDLLIAQAVDPRFDISTWPDATDTRVGGSNIRAISGANQGIYGEKSNAIYARVASIVATYDIDVVVIEDIAINDETGGGDDLTFEQSQDMTTDTVEAFEAADIKVILGTIRKHLSSGNTIDLAAYRSWVLANFGPGTAHPDTIIFDPYNQITTITSDHQKDSTLHPGLYHAMCTALGEDQSIPADSLLGAIRQCVDEGDIWEDIWDNNTRLTDELDPNFGGSGGSGGVGITDNGIATGWFVNRSATASTVWDCSKEDPGDDHQKCEITPSGTEYRNCRWTYNLTAGEVSNLLGNCISCLLEMTLPDQAAISIPYLYLAFSDTDYVAEWGRVGDNTTNVQDCRRTLGAGSSLDLKIMTPPIYMPASGITSCTLRIELQSSAKHDTSAGVVHLRRIGIFAIDDPQTAWLL